MRRIKHLIAAAFLGALVQSSSTSSGQNIVFDRQSGGFVIAQATTETSAVFRSDRKNNRDSTDGISSHKVFLRGDGFRQGIRVGDSSLDLIHLGDGIFNTFGTIAASSEKSRSQHKKDYFIIDIGSVNRLITAQQRVPIDSVKETAVAVELLQLSRTGAARFPIAIDPGGVDYMVGKDAWIWGFNTAAWFFAEDLLDPDDPSEDEGGGPGGGAVVVVQANPSRTTRYLESIWTLHRPNSDPVSRVGSSPQKAGYLAWRIIEAR